MSAILLQVTWLHSVEYIPLDLSAGSQTGSVETYESWDDSDEPIVYQASYAITQNRKGYKVRLAYLYEANKELVDIYELDLGTSEIQIASDLGQATAVWTSDGDPVGSSGAAQRCAIIDADVSNMERETTRYDTSVIARPGQALMRKTLLIIDGCCALTGESTPMVLDAAHISSVADKGIDRCSNGILLRTDLHRLYDGGAFTLDNDGKVSILKSLSVNYMKLLDGAALSPRILSRIGRNLKTRNKTNIS